MCSLFNFILFFSAKKKCTVCVPNVRFKRSYNLKLHMKTAHSQYVHKAVCPVRFCSFPLFSTITNMRVHFKRIHKKKSFPKDKSEIEWIWVLTSTLMNGRSRGQRGHDSEESDSEYFAKLRRKQRKVPVIVTTDDDSEDDNIPLRHLIPFQQLTEQPSDADINMSDEEASIDLGLLHPEVILQQLDDDAPMNIPTDANDPCEEFVVARAVDDPINVSADEILIRVFTEPLEQQMVVQQSDCSPWVWENFECSGGYLFQGNYS